MIRGRRVVAVIPARAGSKGLPGKNLRELAGRPLISWTVDAARTAPSVDRVVVSTDADEIAQTARELGAEVLRRPAPLATDEATAADVVRHALDALGGDADVIAYLQPTSPLRTAHDIEACLDLATAAGDRGVASVRQAADLPEWMFRIDGEGRLERVVSGPMPLRRQDAEPAFVLNGAVYVVLVETFSRTNVLVDAATVAYAMPAARSIDIDTLEDFRAAELALAAVLAEPSRD